MGRTLGHVAINQFNEGYSWLDVGKLDDFISKSTTFANVIADIIQVCQDNTVLDHEPEDPSSPNDIINLSPPSSKCESSSKSCATSKSHSNPSSTTSSSSQSTQSEDENEDDPSNTHLVSGSDHDIYLLDNQLTHDTWYNQECGDNDENSSDDEDAIDSDCGALSDGNNSVNGEDNSE